MRAKRLRSRLRAPPGIFARPRQRIAVSRTTSSSMVAVVRTRFWHPVADMHAVSRDGELVLDRAEGVHLWDERGPPLPRRHRRPLVLQRRLRTRGDRRGGGCADAPPARVLALRRRHQPPHDRSRGAGSRRSRRWTTPSCSSPPAAASRSRRRSSSCDATGACAASHERTIVVSRERAYHGLAGYGTSIVGAEVFKAGAGPLARLTPCVVPWDSADALAAAIDDVGAERVAAFFCEPIIGAGGVLLPPEGYLRGSAHRSAASATCCSSSTR